MKFLVLSALAITLIMMAQSSIDVEVSKKVNEDCFKISRMPKESLDKIKKGVVDLSDDAVKKHIFCYTKTVGFVNDAGVLNDNLIKERLSMQVKDRQKVDSVAKVCNVPKTADEEVNYFAAKVVACYYHNNPGLVIL